MHLYLTTVKQVVEVWLKVYSVGIEVDTVSCATTTTPDIEFIKYFGLNQFVGFSSIPHNFRDKQLVNINGLSDYYRGFDGPYNVGVRTESFISNSRYWNYWNYRSDNLLLC